MRETHAPPKGSVGLAAKMLTSDQATAIAKRYLIEASIQMGAELTLVGPPQKHERGFLFPFNSRAYVETGDLNYALAGNFPFVVNCLTGEIEDSEQPPTR
jgi:hypothetical protein